MATVAQRSFAGGEIAPSLYARVDLAKYATGLKTCRNFFVMRHGGASNRPGTQFIGEVNDSSKTVRLIPFVFNSSQTYVLEFGNLYMRVIKDGVVQTLTGQAITAVTHAAQAVFTYTGADTYSNGDEVAVSGIAGSLGPYINGRNFKISDVDTAANTFKLKLMDGTTYFSTASLPVYTSGGTVAEIYQITTPYIEADLAELKFVQSADVITIVHPTYAPSNLERTGNTAWTLTPISFAPSLLPPTSLVNAPTPGETKYSISSVSSASPAEVTTTVNHGYTTGDIVELARMDFSISIWSGGTYYYTLPKAKYVITVTAVNKFTAIRVDGTNLRRPTGYSYSTTRYTGKSQRFQIAAGTASYVAEWVVTSIAEDTFEESEPTEITGSSAAPTGAAKVTLTWDAVVGAQGYNVYRKDSAGIFGFIAYTEVLKYIDDGTTTPDASSTPPVTKNQFKEVGDFPSAVTYYQQRRVFANTDNDPEKVWASKTGFFTNFTSSSPIQDDDAVIFSMVGRQVNEVRHMIDIGKLIVFTAGGEWTINGNDSGTLLPGNVNPKQASYNGANSLLAPIVIDNHALYVQSRGSIIRDLGFDIESDNYKGNDLTIFSAHLFDKYTLSDWAFQQIPHSILWCVRSDGTLLGLTYVKDHQLVAWHRHDFEGATVENVCVVPEGSRDVLYVVIKRTVGTRTVRYIERMADRLIDDIKDVTILDAFLSYDGRNTGSHTMTLSGSGWTYTDTLTLTASAATFASSDVGNQIQITDPATDEVIRFTIDGYTSATVVTGRPNRDVPVSLHAVATTGWAMAVDQVSGLWHLEGKDVSIFADGFVVANPHNDAYTTRTVANGVVTLDKPYAVIHVGLPITADLETLNLDTANAETMVDKNKLMSKVTLFVEESRGGWVGQEAPEDEDTDFLGGLTEVKVRDDEDYDDPVELRTGTMDVNIQATWNDNGRVFIRQTDPVPMSVLAIAPAGYVPVGR